LSTKLRRIAVLAALIAVASVGGFVWQAVAGGNFHEVLPGQLYRSAQLGPEELGRRIGEYGIRTIVNLRGAQLPGGWYDDEKRLAAQRGVELVDFPMSASKRLTAAQALALVDRLRKAPKPLLVHCLGGADRTGLVSMIYLSQVAGMDEETAEAQLSPLFGHIGIPYLTSSFAMDQTWEELEPLFGIEGS